MIRTIREIWSAILTPSRPDEAAYDRLVIAIAHAVLGAALATLLAPYAAAGAAVGRLGLTALYALVKEGSDRRRGGSLRDSLWDTAAVALGMGYGTTWWPVTVLCLALATALDRKGDQ